MMKFTIDVGPEFVRLMKDVGPEGLRATRAAFNTAAQLIEGTWKEWANGGSLQGIPQIKSPSTNLAQSIHTRENAPFDVNIETDSPYMKRIQEGTDELDMKKTHPYGKKSRVSKKTDEKHPGGIPYLIVPFRWGAGKKRAHFGGNFISGAMYKQALTMAFSRKIAVRGDGSTAIHVEKNYRGQPVERQEYKWGDRLNADGNANGMVRFPDDTKSDGSEYFTFRIISAASPKGSWIRPAVPAVDVLSALERTTRPKVEEIIEAGLQADLAND
ncbi:MAG: hypothetical protein LBB72_01500 [Spirochaetaceae bacterium]|jgi:hypothetical protein|nr:hypothetical protein [Spirochaetaceae bacterium]